MLKRTKCGVCGNEAKVALYKGITDLFVGDAYMFVGIERNTKLVLAWHLGDRDVQSTEAFIEN